MWRLHCILKFITFAMLELFFNIVQVVHIQGGSNMTGTNCDLFTHNQSRSYLNHLVYTGYTHKNGAVSKVNKKRIADLTLAQRTPSAAGTVPSFSWATSRELRDRITHSLQTITEDTLHRVWDEFHYRVHVCRVTQGAHTEGLWLAHEKLGQLPLLTVYVVPV
jgi:hypothetical protein